MQYLSDKIYVNYLVPSNNAYAPYVVSVKNPRENTWTDIYTGRVFGTGDTQQLFLNDIIKNYAYNTSLFKPSLDGGIPVDNTDFGRGLLQKFRVQFAVDATYETDWVMSYFKDDNLPPVNKSFDPTPNLVVDGLNLLSVRTSVLPRIPRLATASENFWLGVMVIPTNGLYNNSISGTENCFDIVNDLETYVRYPVNNGVYVRNIYNNSAEEISDLYDLTRGSILYLRQYKSTVGVQNRWKTPVARVDECPADYYVIWMDRTGGYQCQPFSGRMDYSENIASTNVVNALEETRPYMKNVDSIWSLHTDLLTDEEHKAYASLLTSPYIYLYDTKNDMGIWCYCTDSSWKDKVYKNQKKMFSLNVNLKSSAVQSMIY